MALFQNQSVHHKSGRNSVAECQLPKLKVVGSNPIARSILIRRKEKGPRSLQGPFFVAAAWSARHRPPPNRQRVSMSRMRGTQPPIFPAIMHFKCIIARKRAEQDRTIHIPWSRRTLINKKFIYVAFGVVIFHEWTLF